MRPNHVLRAWRAGKLSVGGWLTIDSSLVAEALAQQRFDWLCVDMQHGLIDYADAVAMMTAISTTHTVPFVRVPWNEPSVIMKVLDAGAYGVIVPLVNNGAEAARAVAACRYPPRGIRSSGPARAALYGGANYALEANDEIACVVMIETAEALEHLDEIMATPGVDAAYIGPSDLALALGIPATGDNADPRHAQAVQAIFDAAKRHGVAPGIHTSSAAFTTRYLQMGFQMVTLGADRGFLVRQAAADMAAVREATGLAPLSPA